MKFSKGRLQWKKGQIKKTKGFRPEMCVTEEGTAELKNELRTQSLAVTLYGGGTSSCLLWFKNF